MEQLEIYKILKENPEEGFSLVLDHYGNLMYSVALNVLHDPQDAEDCLSEALLRLWKKYHQLKRADSLKNYLCAITRNTAIDILRKRNKIDAELLEELKESLMVNDFYGDKLDHQVISDQIKMLGEPDSTIFLRRYWNCESIHEIAAGMHMTRGAVESRLHRGKVKLKNLLQDGGYFE